MNSLIRNLLLFGELPNFFYVNSQYFIISKWFDVILCLLTMLVADPNPDPATKNRPKKSGLAGYLPNFIL